jgi:hypothetical protein
VHKDDEKPGSHRKAGRPRGRAPRPHIKINGDELWPVSDIAADWGTCERTVKRILGNNVGYHTGVAYARIGVARAELAKGFTAKRRRRVRR